MAMKVRLGASAAAFLVVMSSPVAAATYDVGAGQNYANLAALPALGAGDVVQIHSGTYNEVKRFTASGAAASPITIRGMGSPRPVFDANGKTVDGALPNPRAVFQIEGSYVVVENLEFVNARNGDNGAGIRVTGSNANHVVIRNCYIHDNDMGIMSDGNDDLLVDSSEIALNGTDLYSGFSHNFYLGGNRTTVQYSYIHDSLYGQNVKSRGHFTVLLYNYIADSQDGEVGLVDATETATANSNAVMIGNVVVSKPRGAAWNHGRFVWFGQDSGGAHDGTLYVLNNTFMAGDSRIYFLDANVAGASIAAYNNVFSNSDTIAGGTGIGPVTGSNNFIPSGATPPSGFSGTTFQGNPGFVNPVARDFHLLPTSPLIDKAAEALSYVDASGASQLASPLFEYVVDLGHTARPVNLSLDIGAYEYATTPDDGGAGGATGSGGSNGSTGGSANAGAGGSALGNGGAGDASVGGSSSGSGGSGNVGGGVSGGGGSTSESGGASGAPAAGTGASTGSMVDAGVASSQAEDTGGCGCVLAARTPSGSGWLLTAAALAAAARRRRARFAQ